jgi:hypothetical protein
LLSTKFQGKSYSCIFISLKSFFWNLILLPHKCTFFVVKIEWKIYY